MDTLDLRMSRSRLHLLLLLLQAVRPSEEQLVDVEIEGEGIEPTASRREENVL